MTYNLSDLQATFIDYVTETLDEVNEAQTYLESLSTIDRGVDTIITMLNVAEEKLMSLEVNNVTQGRRVCERLGGLLLSISVVDNSIGSFLRKGNCSEGSSFNSCMAYAGKDFNRLSKRFEKCRDNS